MIIDRHWPHPQGWDGPRWSAEQIKRFERLMRQHSQRTPGRTPLVSAWDDGGCCEPWYCAHAGRAERTLRAACEAIFGQKSQPVRFSLSAA